MNADAVFPAWRAPDWVRALSSTRRGGVSEGPWGLADGRTGGLNLGTACGDDPVAVAENRRRLRERLPAEPAWLRQVHGCRVLRVEDAPRACGPPPVADAAVTSRPGRVLAVQTADCLPVLFADGRREVVGAAHAGWRGLAGGVLEATIEAMCELGASPASLLAWIGPGIGPRAFEVGDDVRDAFVAQDDGAGACFVPLAAPGKWLADLPALAARRLSAAGLATVVPSGLCTVGDPQRFYSYRRDGQCGRMVSLIWIAR